MGITDLGKSDSRVPDVEDRSTEAAAGVGRCRMCELRWEALLCSQVQVNHPRRLIIQEGGTGSTLSFL